MTRSLKCIAIAALAAALLFTVGASAATAPIVKLQIGYVNVPAGQTRTLTVPFPDALKFGNATYSGAARILAPVAGAKGRAPNLHAARILESQPVQGGSAYQARAHNSNRRGTAAVRLSVTAKTIEPLPHS
jgi:hypothetical protein